MGDWYVIANIPTFIEKKATNAIESYELMDDANNKNYFLFNEPRGQEKSIQSNWFRL